MTFRGGIPLKCQFSSLPKFTHLYCKVSKPTVNNGFQITWFAALATHYKYVGD